MITEKTYLEMKEIIAKHEAEQLTIHNVVNCVERPYLEIVTVETEKSTTLTLGMTKYVNVDIAIIGTSTVTSKWKQ
jgi:hypothetical protein